MAMAQFKVDPQQIQNQAVSLRSLSTVLDTVANELSGIRIHNSISFASTVMLNLKIFDCQIASQNQRGNLQSLGQALEEIAELYRANENTIVSNVNGNGDANTCEGQTDANPTAGMTYEEILEYRAEHAVDENTRRLYEKYRGKVDIKSDDYDGTAHYNNFWNEINYNAEEDAENPRGPGCTYYHEVGHLIDDQSDWNSTTSTDWSYDFYDCLQNDVDNWIRNCMEKNGYTDINDAYAALTAWLLEDGDMKNGISDLVNGLTDGNAHGRWGHWDDGYYNSSSIPREAFAHFFEAGMASDPAKLEYIKEIFPTAYAEYQQMITDELG